MAHTSLSFVTAPPAEAIAAIRAGDRARARALLSAALKQNPGDATAWLWLSGALTDPAEQRYCLEQALAAEPGLGPAQRGLAMLTEVVAQAPVEFEPPTKDQRPKTKDQSPLAANPGSQIIDQEYSSSVLRPSSPGLGAKDHRPLPLNPQPSALRSPSSAIWTQPWAAMHVALDERNPWETGFLGALAGVNIVLAWAAQRNLGDQARPAEIIGLALLGGPLVGLSVLVLGGVLLRSSGRWLGGRGGAGAVRAALAWAGTPLIGGVLLWLAQLILLPAASFSSAPVAPPAAISALVFGGIHLALALWAAGLSLVGLAVAHGFGIIRAILSWLLAGLFVVVIAFAVGFGTATLIGLRGG